MRASTPAILSLILLAATPWTAVSAQSVRIQSGADDLVEQLRTSPPNRPVSVAGVRTDDRASPQLTLELQRMRVSDAESRVVLHSRSGSIERPLPRRHYFHGQVDGDPASRALLILADNGNLSGLVHRGGRIEALRIGEAGLGVVPVDTESVAEPMRCGATDLPLPPPLPRDIGSSNSDVRGVPADGYLARVAFETDFEYYQRFGNADDAAAYAMDLVAFSSTIYASESSTRLGLSVIHLWTDSSDPWNEFGTLCGLFEFGKYWNDNRSEDRTIAHFLSGKNNGGGVAWVGVLCRGPFNVNTADAGCNGFSDTSNYGGDYGFSGDLDGNFDLSNPAAVWDLVVVAHEIGHNFNSPHTHCYAGLEGNAQPVDQCFSGESGCYSGAQTLPGPQGQGSGTIMSYCHLLSGGLSNIGLTLGLDHPYGVAPQRVPDRMMAAAIGAESSNPGCLTTELGAELSLVAVDPDVIEGEDVLITLQLDRAASTDVLVDLSVDAALTGNLGNLAGHLIPAGMSQLSLQLPTTDDEIYTGLREGQLSIGSVTGDAPIALGVDSLTVAIADDEQPTSVLTLGSGTSSVTEGETLGITLSIDPVAAAPIDITLAPAPELDGRIESGLGPVTIPAGNSSAVLPVVFIDDSIDQPDLTAGIGIGVVSSASPTATGTPDTVTFDLLDNDARPVAVTLQLATDSVVEGGTVLATVQLDQTTSVPVQVDIGASAGLAQQIQSGLGVQTLPSGMLETSFELVFIDDDQLIQARLDGSISIDAVLSPGNASPGAPSSQPLSWQDNDLPPDYLLTDSFEGQ